MDIIICGAGQVGTHAAQVLTAAGHKITVLDLNAQRIAAIEDTMDLATLTGNCANADLLREAGASDADLLIAATSADEINLLTAAVAKGVGARKCIARVHHSAYFDQRGLDYCETLGIDQMICPDYATAQAIGSMLRNPGAMAVESFARGQVEMQEFGVAPGAKAVGKALSDLAIPPGMRVAVITRRHEAFIPDGATIVEANDAIVLVGNTDVFERGKKPFDVADLGRQRVVLMGGAATSVWLCRTLRGSNVSIRLFEEDRARAEELASKLEWVTVLHGDPTDRSVFDEEHLEQADAFVGLLVDDDEQNILRCAWAKSMGVKTAVAVVENPNYLRLLKPIGIDYAYTPRMLAAREILGAIDESALQSVATLAEGIINVYRMVVRPGAPIVGKPLATVKLSPNWMIAAVQRKQEVRVPLPDASLQAGDVVLVIGRHGMEEKLTQLFTTG
ncbi:MAG: Trk system potassium transporter TrkA [Planctomycetaceae bacterium]|nr:Trk system potassium transporter TrkA [Planctomycetaceae bacterium]